MASSYPSPPTDPAIFGTLDRLDGIAWLVLNEPGRKVNTLSSRALLWLDDVLAGLEAEPPRGLVVMSGKPGCFVAGADLEELAQWTDPEGVRRMLGRGHELLLRLEALPTTSVAAIDGACLGGGLELALACTFRAATTAPETQLGLPEVQLGLIPGLGGTQRLPRLIGVAAALDLVTTGRSVDAQKALRLGLVDEACHRRDLGAAVERLLARKPPRRRRPRAASARWTTFAATLPGFEQLIFGRARRAVEAATGGHYQAPLAAVKAMAGGLKKTLPRALAYEAEIFAERVVSAEAKHLTAIFFMKNDADARAAELARGALPVATLGVMGAGFMGAGIAQLAALKGLPVVLKDQDAAGLTRGMKQAGRLVDELVRRRKLGPAEARTVRARLRPTLEPEPFAGADLVIEAIYEDLAAKREALKQVEKRCRPRLVYASNTSTLPIADIAQASRRPARVVGMHFFSPVHKMPLIEIIQHRRTSPEALATAVQMGRRLGKTVIVVNDGVGFFTTRVLSAFLNEATWCLVEGATVPEIDGALTRWGFPVGPMALMDEVGLDVARHVGRVMHDAFGERLEAPAVIERLVADGRLGRKSGKGFYLYGSPQSAQKKKVDRRIYPLLGWQRGRLSEEEIADRCFLALLNETARTLEDGVIENPVDVDLAMIFGLGFPAFRGGLLREAERQGLAVIVERLESYARRLEPRFTPAPLLVGMASTGTTFYPPG